MWVADFSNQRVIWFNAAHTIVSNQPNANGVLGQPNFTSNSPAITQAGMHIPYGVVEDNAGRLWVADLSNHRILRFDNAGSKANGANADGVLGQVDFTSSGSGTTQAGMNGPIDIEIDGTGRLYVTSIGNHRVLIFDNAVSKANGANADNVLGQANFTSNSTGITATTMRSQYNSSLAIDNTNNFLWVSDTGNGRVMRFTASSALPVALVEFKGQATVKGNRLTWQTASEENNDGFEIQRSVDGNEWKTLDFVLGNGTTSEISNYEFMDNDIDVLGIDVAGRDVALQRLYYRLKQIDIDGQFEYSDVINLTIEQFNNKIIEISPNPIQDELNIVDGQGQATIYNVLGQQVKQFSIPN